MKCYVKLEMTAGEQEAYKKIEKEIDKYIIVEYEYKGVELNYTIGQAVYSSKKSGPGFRFAFDRLQDLAPAEEALKKGVAGFSSHLKNVASGGGLGQDTIEF